MTASGKASEPASFNPPLEPIAMTEPDITTEEIIKNLSVGWVVRQQVSTAFKSWLVDVMTSKHRHVAQREYDRLVRENPDDYFELVATMSSEVCKAFTPHKGKRWTA